ncbi:hypothetical protein DL769_010175 [Monosporascus sp. CRB-8-3]|nr:hypothetical protein DL769_010175 [Monosporascus sp. CRB-8-3]
MSNSLASTATVVPGLEHVALSRRPAQSFPPTRPRLTSTASETTLVGESKYPNGRRDETKPGVEDEEVSDVNSQNTSTRQPREKTSGSITNAVAKVKSKLKGKPTSHKSPSRKNPSPKGSLSNPSMLSTWQALAELK